jgi:hypothetical protein
VKWKIQKFKNEVILEGFKSQKWGEKIVKDCQIYTLDFQCVTMSIDSCLKILYFISGFVICNVKYTHTCALGTGFKLVDIKRQINICFFIFMIFMLIPIKFDIDVKTRRKFHSEVLFCFVLGTQQQTVVLGLSLARIRDCTFRTPKSGRYSQWFRKVQFLFFFFFNLLYLLLLLLLLSFLHSTV